MQVQYFSHKVFLKGVFMFTLDQSTNRILPMQAKTFSELGYNERYHLQEWICNQPDALGEELLIIQKEFSGFNDTNERLDLLAIDKNHNLVIIENKLDDSGRDVVWQALKYASYCANLNKSEIIDIYQQYLNKEALSKNASEKIAEFLCVDDLEEITINAKNNQRIMLVAANFRKEVTNTVLWLLEQGLNIQCIKVTPYTYNEQCFININQIIPTPETNEFLIRFGNKETDEKKAIFVQRKRHIIRNEYWRTVLDAFSKSKCRLFDNINPSKEHWISAGSGVSNCTYQLNFGNKFIRIILYFDKTIAEENKFIFDYLYQHKEKIEQEFENKLEWVRLDDKKSSRLQFELEVDGYNKEEWPNFVNWQVENMQKLEKATREFLQQASNALKGRSSQ